MDFCNMTLKEKVLQTFIVTIREVNRHGGPDQFFQKYPVGGMYYAKSQDPEIEEKIEMGTATCQKHLRQCRSAAGYPLLVCADGVLIEGQKITANARSLGASGKEEDAYLLGKILGMQMNANDIDWILGPCVDLFFDRSMPLFAMSDDPVLTARLYRQVIRGIQDQGVCATAKHFPGMGTNNINMHFGPGKNVLGMKEWRESYGYIYQQMIEEGVLSIMTTHTTLKAYDEKGADGYYPIATYSEKLTKGLLKTDLGFEGAVVTDALIMGGMATGDLIAETVQAFKSGADLLLWPPVEAADKIAEALESGEIPMKRLEDALGRIQKMREFREKAMEQRRFDPPELAFAEEASQRIMANGICILRNDIGLLPLKLKKDAKILILDAADEEGSRSCAMLKDALKARGFSVDIQRNIYDVESRVCWQDDIDALQDGYELVILNVNASYATAWNVPFMLIWASHLFQKGKKLIVNYGSPFFAPDYFPEDPTIVEMNTPPSEAAAKLLVQILFGERPALGACVLKRTEGKTLFKKAAGPCQE